MSKPRDKKVASAKLERLCYLKAADLLAYEAESLQRMAVTPWPTTLSWWKRALLEASTNARNQGQLHLHVWFEAADPRAANNAPCHIIELGAQVIPSGTGSASYFFAIGESLGTQRRGLRKLNFDLDYNSNTREPKPAMHTQVSGRLPPSMSDRYPANSFDFLMPKLDKPRIACLPKSFALLAHLAFLEYHSTDSGLSNLVYDPTWLAVVRSAEDKILKPHFEYCAEWMGKTDFRSRSLLSHFYGLPRS